MSIVDYPDQVHGLCRSTSWWYREASPDKSWPWPAPPGPPGWVCAACSPSPDPSVMLKARILKGNWQLNRFLATLKALPEDNREEARVKMKQASDLIYRLTQEFKAISTACLYMEKGKKMKSCLSGPFHCFGCPNDYWPDKEIMENKQQERR